MDRDRKRRDDMLLDLFPNREGIAQRPERAIPTKATTALPLICNTTPPAVSDVAKIFFSEMAKSLKSGDTACA